MMSKKFIVSGLILGALFALIGIVSVKYCPAKQGPIVDFNYARDAQTIKNFFDQDMYWLVADPENYSVDFMLKYRSYSQDYLTAGKLQIKVIRDDNATVGFVAYYKKSVLKGFILFLDVDDAYRAKGYGQMLAQHAIDDLFAQGVTSIDIVTRPSNLRALRLYNRLGFVETARDKDFVYLHKLKSVAYPVEPVASAVPV